MGTWRGDASKRIAFFKFKDNPSSIDSSWLSFFNSLNEDEISILKDFGGPKWKKSPSNIIEDISLDKVVKNIPNIGSQSFKISTLDSIRALRLIRAFRINGHLIANLDPLGIAKKDYHPELDYKNYGFNEDDLNKEIFIDGSLGLEKATLNHIIKLLKELLDLPNPGTLIINLL